MTGEIALIGNPNCGKSTLFNRLTGLRQSVSNLPGTTVEKKIGTWQGQNQQYGIVDLPGIYSLYAESEDEQVVTKSLLGEDGKPVPEKILFVLDASNLRRNLLLFSQVAELQIPMLVLLTMGDSATKKGIAIDSEALSQKLGVPVLNINPRTGFGLTKIEPALKTACKAHFVIFPDDCRTKLLQHLQTGKPKGIAAETLSRYTAIAAIIDVCTHKIPSKKQLLRGKLDRLFTHKYAGYLIFLLVMLTIFQGVFTLAEYPMGWIENGFAWLTEFTGNNLPKNEFSQMITEGLIPGLAGVVGFVPQIAILFFFVGLLEDSGYMVRTSFITDRVMRKIGLNGRSVIPLISGFACAIPSIMATRSIKHKGERLATMFVIPLMSCSARLPVYTLLVSLAIPASSGFGPFNTRSLVMTAAYFAGIVAAVLLAMFFKRSNQKNGQSEFVLELPAYQWPRLTNVLMQMGHKCMSFIGSAGKIIVVISLILWWLSSHGPGNRMQEARNTASIEKSATSISVKDKELEASYAGHMGKFIEPAIKPLGFDWKTGIAIITSFAAREVFAGTMATLFRGDPDNPESIREIMKEKKNPETGAPLYGVGYALSLMVFYAFALQCMSTLAIMKRETGSWKWPTIQFFLFLAMAWVGSFVVYNLVQ